MIGIIDMSYSIIKVNAAPVRKCPELTRRKQPCRLHNTPDEQWEHYTDK